MQPVCYGPDTALNPIQHHVALILDWARAQELPLAPLLDAAGLSTADLRAAEQVSPAQLLAMLGALVRQPNGRESAFHLGQQWLPGHYGPASLALLHAASLQQALDILVAHRASLCPLLAPRYRTENGELLVYWTDSCGAGPLLPYLVELHQTALTALCRWLSGERLPWRYQFNRTRPRDTACHDVHLGPRLHFAASFDTMHLDAAWLAAPWPRGNARAAELALGPLAGDVASASSLRDAVYDYLLAHIRLSPTLDQVALAFHTSPATLKRQLARHGTHFQALLDQVRTHVSVWLMHYRGYSHEQLAEHFGFHDARNFRRSFQRWTGITPACPEGELWPRAAC